LRDAVDIVATVAGWGMNEPFVENAPEFWRKLIDLNLLGTIAVLRAFLEPMMQRKYGKIITLWHHGELRLSGPNGYAPD